jgi:hypothetical protein
MVREADNMILGTLLQDDQDAGPIMPQHPPEDGVALVWLDVEFTRAGRSDTEVAYLIDGEIAWVETKPLDTSIADAINAIDGAADALRLRVIARQTNTEEYKRSEAQARSFKAAGYPADDVPSCVASWAKAKYRQGWTAQQAADDIIATADRWYGVLDAIRELRLCAKEDVRHAATHDEVRARTDQFDADLQSLMAQ